MNLEKLSYVTQHILVPELGFKPGSVLLDLCPYLLMPTTTKMSYNEHICLKVLIYELSCILFDRKEFIIFQSITSNFRQKHCFFWLYNVLVYFKASLLFIISQSWKFSLVLVWYKQILWHLKFLLCVWILERMSQ